MFVQILWNRYLYSVVMTNLGEKRNTEQIYVFSPLLLHYTGIRCAGCFHKHPYPRFFDVRLESQSCYQVSTCLLGVRDE